MTPVATGTATPVPEQLKINIPAPPGAQREKEKWVVVAEEGRKLTAHAAAFPNARPRSKSPPPSFPVRLSLPAARSQSSVDPIAKDGGSDMDTPEAVAQDKKVRAVSCCKTRRPCITNRTRPATGYVLTIPY